MTNIGHIYIEDIERGRQYTYACTHMHMVSVVNSIAITLNRFIYIFFNYNGGPLSRDPPLRYNRRTEMWIKHGN